MSGRGLRAFGRVPGSMQAPANGVGQRYRALVGQSGERLGRPHRFQVMGGDGRRQLVDLDGHEGIGSGAAADGEDVLEVLDRLRRPHLDERALELVDADRVREMTAHEADPITRRQPALPRERLDLERLAERGGDASLADARVLLAHRRRRRNLVHAPVADHDGTRRPELGDVRLPTADDDRHHADARSARDGEAPALVVEAPIGSGQGFRQGDKDAGREVVVVLGPQRVERVAGGLCELWCRAGELRDHEQAALGPGLGADRRLVEDDEVAGIGGPLLG